MTGHIGRREFVALLASTAVWPFAARAQHSERMRRIGVLMGLVANDPEAQSRVAAFENSLRELGWVKGRNLSIEYRWAGDGDGLRGHVAELLAMEPDLILANITPVTAALQKQSRGVPIVFTQVSDPVGQGFVSNLAQPGGNLTGFTSFEFSIGTKWLEALKQTAPHVTRVLLMFNPQSAPFADLFVRPVEAAAPNLSVAPIRAAVRDTNDVDRMFDALAGVAGHQHDELSRGDRRAGGAPPRASDLPVSLFCCKRRSDVLRYQPERSIVARSQLCRPHPQGREASRSTGTSADQV